MVPAEEGLHADDPAVVGLDDRLVVRTQLAVLDGAAEVTLEAGALVGQVLLAEVDDLVSGAPAPLGLVHRGVRLAEDLLGELVTTSREGDTHTDAGLEDRARQDERSRDRRADPSCDRVDLRGVVDVLTQDDELVARHACERVSRAQRGGQSMGDGPQQLIADRVPVQIVHRLEVVEIQEQNSRHLARPSRSEDCVFESLEQQCPVGQPGQRVVQRHLAGSVDGVA